MKQEIEIPEGKRAEWQSINGITQLVLVDDNPTNPVDEWQDPDIYPVWKDKDKPHTLENLDGIRIPVIDGTEILLYPKYKECRLLSNDKIEDCKIPCQNNPLYAEHSAKELTDMWFALGSEAAKHVRSFDKDLPLPIWGLAIARYKDKIDELAKILGGDLLADISTYYWCGVRYYASFAWVAYGTSGSFGNNHFFNAYIALPVSLLTKTA